MLDQLRQELRKLEPAAGFAASARLCRLGPPPVDALLGGGLAHGAVHEIAAASEAHIAAATGFALGVANVARTTIWIAEDIARIESGAPCGPGLDEFHLAPERLITVDVRCRQDLLWAMEEALRCRSAGVVIGELRSSDIDMVSLRRLSLAASVHGALAILLRATPGQGTSTAATRWIIAASRSQFLRGEPGAPRFQTALIRNRRGPLGSWMLEWSKSDECFILGTAHPQPVALPVIDRPARAAVA